MPRPAAMPAPAAEAEHDWSGAYVGMNLGALRGTSTATEIQTISDFANLNYCAPAGTAGVPTGEYWCNVNGSANYTSSPVSSFNKIGDTWGNSMKGWSGAVTAGYNQQMGHLVYGVEADYGMLSMRGTTGPSPASRDDTYLHTNATDYSTARLRLGYAYDRLLLFTTAGVAAGHFNSYVDDPDIAIGVMTQKTGTQFGYALGAGAEYALTDHVSIKADFLNMGFKGQDSIGYVNVTCTASPCQVPQWKLNRLGMAGDGTAGWRISHTVNLMRMGLNYKF